MTDFDMNSFQNVFSACVDKVKVRDGAGRAHVVSKADGKRAAEGRLELEPASAFSDKREDPKISALRLKLEPLDARRQKLALKSVQQTVKKSRHCDMFTKLENPHISRGGAKRLWREPPCKTK